MKVQIGEHTYQVKFSNRSERVVHDRPGREAAYELLRTAHPNVRRWLKLRPTTHISTITTRCVILNESAVELSRGVSYYSQSEPIAGQPFDRTRARALSLRRALGTAPDTRLFHAGVVWADQEQTHFWSAFEHLLKRQATQAREKGRTLLPLAGRSMPVDPSRPA